MNEARTSRKMSPGLLRVMERAKRNPHERQFSLAHLIDEEALKRAYGRVRKKSAAGVDGMSKSEYGIDLDERIRDLHQRLKTLKYRHQPIRRVHIPKPGNRTRPIGISTVEDKLVQGALTEILEAMYEAEFLDCSYGFRRRRSPHGAMRQLVSEVRKGGINVILEADIKSFFDGIVRPNLMEMLQKRIADKSFMRLVGKCLHVGVLDDGSFIRPDTGTVQGSIISPMLGNIYLHNVLDIWFEQEVKTRLSGRAFLIRYCDDFIIGFERMEDAQRVKGVLGKRMEKYGLTLHPEKTRLVKFKRPSLAQKGGKGGGNFDFLGFTVYWKQNRSGIGWHMACKTRKAKLSAAINAVYQQCRIGRHSPMSVQHKALVDKVRGHFGYFGVNDNIRCLKILQLMTKRAWFKWLNRRSQRSKMTWDRFSELLDDYPLPHPRVYVNLWETP